MNRTFLQKTNSKSYILQEKEAKHGENNFFHIKLNQFDWKKMQKLEGFIHAFDLQTGYKVWV